MRYILGLRLKTGAILNIVGDFNNKESAKGMAVEMSNKLLGDNLRLAPDCEIVSSETWAQDKKVYYQNGNLNFMAVFMFNGVVQNMNVISSGVKGAYNNIKIDYGITMNPIMLLYNTNQVIRKASAVIKSRSLVRDEKQLRELIKIAERKILNDGTMSNSFGALKAMISLLSDFKQSKYTKIEAEKLIIFVAALIKVVYPDKYDLDINANIAQANEMQGLQTVLNMLSPDIQKYYTWICGNDGGDGDIVIV